ncbi:unnamed protein product [Rotaria sordida]|uniref:Uncharacterized protein n=1 Tax=Rotaria sordida TaxID=392033 RepID=A0A819ZTS9_9BILA|nr:unnamed protein product [Rotaria sordida]CAF4150892.1 unnamed protein product [Rotaria sordida]CAF4177510.1 unnamed protein product [Rotaria sordida]
MAEKRSRSDYIVSSSDSETSNEEHQRTTTTETQMNCSSVNHMCKTIKHLRSSSDHQTEHDINQILSAGNNTSFIDVAEINNNQESNISYQQITNITIENNNSFNHQRSIDNKSDGSLHTLHGVSTPPIQQESSYQEINVLNEKVSNFRIRCKTIYKSFIRYFGTCNKVFDAIVCDMTGEIKVVAFNENVDRLYENMMIHQVMHEA